MGWVVSLTPQSLYSREKSPLNPPNKRLVFIHINITIIIPYQPTTIKILWLFYQYKAAPRHGSEQKALILVPSCDNNDDLPGPIPNVESINK
jgi:hypothetical protein